METIGEVLCSTAVAFCSVSESAPCSWSRPSFCPHASASPPSRAARGSSICCEGCARGARCACAGALARHRHLNVLTRQGAPHFLRDLEGVSAGQAKTIIILQPDTAKVWPTIGTPYR